MPTPRETRAQIINGSDKDCDGMAQDSPLNRSATKSGLRHQAPSNLSHDVAPRVAAKGAGALGIALSFGFFNKKGCMVWEPVEVFDACPDRGPT